MFSLIFCFCIARVCNTNLHTQILKVAINSLETDSNKQTITSNVSGSTLNNNNKTSGNNQQQQQQSATEAKENNFEYDDNEWDVGGICDLIKDLDNDIKKTSETVSQSTSTTSEGNSSNSRSSSSSPSNISTPSSTSNLSAQQTNQHSQSHTPENTLDGIIESYVNRSHILVSTVCQLSIFKPNSSIRYTYAERYGNVRSTSTSDTNLSIRTIKSVVTFQTGSISFSQ